MKIAISCETTVDVQSDLLEKFNINVVPFTVQLGEEIKLDGEVSTDEIINYVTTSKRLPKTSSVNEYQYNEFFKKLLEDNDAIIHFSLSSEMSSAYKNAVSASRNFNNVLIIDSRTLSTGIALLAIYARNLSDKGIDLQTIYNECLKRRENVQASFVLSRLDYLYKGGRCSALSLFGANLLKIKPEIIVKDGKMIVGKKFRGAYDFAVKKYVDDILNEYCNPDKENVFITYTTATDEIINWVYDRLKEFGFNNIYVTRANGTITSHCGENCLGILYINDCIEEKKGQGRSFFPW